MKNKYIFLYITGLIIIDQLVKFFIENRVLNPVEIIPGFLAIKPIRNYGISFSLLSGNQLFIIILSLIACGILIKYIIEYKDNKFYTIALSVMFAGALGNLIDRIFRGYVVDYISVTIQNHSFAIFNLADIMLVCATFTLAIKIILDEKGKNEKNSN